MTQTLRTETSIRIDRDVEAVFDYLTDIEAMEGWVNGLSDVEHVEGTAGETGALYRFEQDFMGQTGQVELTIGAADRPTRLVVDVPAAAMPFTSEFSLQAIDDGTRVTNAVTGAIGSRGMRVFNAVAGPLLRWLARRDMHEELEHLRDILEADDPTAHAGTPARSAA